MYNVVEPVHGVDSARLRQVFDNLDQKIIELSAKLEKYRSYNNDAITAERKSKTNERCMLKCAGDDLECIRQCTHPVVNLTSNDALKEEFPIDFQRLDSDIQLRNTFQRYQTSPSSIQPIDSEATSIADIFAMPVATAALSDETWAKAMEIISDEAFEMQLQDLVNNWTHRSSSYSPESQRELARKINRHDKDGRIMDMVERMKYVDS